MKKKELIAALLLVTTPAIANVPADTARVIDIEDAVVVARPKENVKLRQTPTSVSLLSADDMQKNGIVGLHNLTGVVPNLFMPDYGSHITSAVYIRGIGSRINTPAIGLYIDNMPVIDKSTYDFHFLDVERIDVLRGPQGTLYGRNTMGGLIHAYTRDPFRHQGTEITIGSATRNTLRKASIMTYQKLNDQLAFSFGGFYEGENGFFRNDSTGKKVDASQQAGVRFRGTYKATSNLRFNLTSSYEYIDEGAYPYLYNGATKGKKESYPTLIGGITANHEGRYRRSLFQTGLTTEYKAPQFTLTSATGYQNLSDRMFMDQDFIKANIYTLEQKQNANTLTEEITFKSKPNKRWQWATGVFGMYQMMRTEAPVNFYSDGMNFLNSVISNAFSSIPEPIASKLQMKLHINNPDLCIDGQFNTPVLNGAIYHQSTFRDFLINRLSLTLGMRLDYEHQSIRYNSKAAAPINYTFSMNPRMLPHPVTMETAPKIADKTNNDFTQLLPKIGFQYELPKKQGTIYATASKGYRSGGYNIQMFSDLIQTQMINDMKAGIKSLLPPSMQGMIGSHLEGEPLHVGNVKYKPEYSWNYEVGVHHDLFEHRLQVDFALFYIDTHDQQIARYSNSGMGRMMINAGRSHSCGIELALRHSVLEGRMNIAMSYGYTNARFDKFDAGKDASGIQHDYSDNKVPMIPAHTLGAQADYTLAFHHKALKTLTFGANFRGLGRIYWTEANDTYQNFYATLGANVLANFGKISINLWGKNITKTDYKTFYFESMSRGYSQKGTPLQFGIDLKLSI